MYPPPQQHNNIKRRLGECVDNEYPGLIYGGQVNPEMKFVIRNCFHYSLPGAWQPMVKYLAGGKICPSVDKKIGGLYYAVAHLPILITKRRLAGNGEITWTERIRR